MTSIMSCGAEHLLDLDDGQVRVPHHPALVVIGAFLFS